MPCCADDHAWFLVSRPAVGTAQVCMQSARDVDRDVKPTGGALSRCFVLVRDDEMHVDVEVVRYKCVKGVNRLDEGLHVAQMRYGRAAHKTHTFATEAFLCTSQIAEHLTATLIAPALQRHSTTVKVPAHRGTCPLPHLRLRAVGGVDRIYLIRVAPFIHFVRTVPCRQLHLASPHARS